MKIAVVAEGETEIGSADGKDPGFGVATTLVTRLLGAQHDDDLVLLPLKLSSQVRAGAAARRGEAETAALAVAMAEARGCDGMVIFRDGDAMSGERRRLNLEGLGTGAALLDRPLPAVLALQVRRIEAWLLADAGAFERAFRRQRPDLPKPPEELWGLKRTHDSNHPCQVYRRVLGALGLPLTRQTAITLAEHADLEVLARECPEGFGRFKTDFERAFRPFACVVAADAKNGIGLDNDMPWPRLKADLKHFREVTSSAPAGKRNAVIMGRKTWESIPSKYRPLPDRLNVVITRGTVEVPDGALVARSLDDALNRACLTPDVDGLFVVGGGEIYRHAFAHVRCRNVYLTRVEHEFECDTFIPEPRDRFSIAEPLGSHDDSGYSYTIQRLSRPPHA